MRTIVTLRIADGDVGVLRVVRLRRGVERLAFDDEKSLPPIHAVLTPEERDALVRALTRIRRHR